jgi:hypothetical protein
MFGRLATTITALSRRVDRITVQECVDCRGVTERQMLVDLMGMASAQTNSASTQRFSALSSQYEQSLAATRQSLEPFLQ